MARKIAFAVSLLLHVLPACRRLRSQALILLLPDAADNIHMDVR